MVRDLQTHELPSDRASLVRLARSLGMDGPDELKAEYERQTTLVRGLHERLFYRPLLEAFTGPKVPRPRSEARSGGKAWVSTGRSRGAPGPSKKKKNTLRR